MEATPKIKVIAEHDKAVGLDIVFSPASAGKPAALDTPTDSGPNTTVEEIQKKLDDAAERRKSIIEERQAALSTQLAKAEEIHQRKQERDAQFIKQTKEALDQKLEVAEEKRISMLNDLKAKVKEELDKVQKQQETKETEETEQAQALLSSIQEKLETAAANRDQNLQAITKRVREHEENVAKVLATQKEHLTALKEKIDAQLEKAAENRESKIQGIVEAAKEREKKVEMVKQRKDSIGDAQ